MIPIFDFFTDPVLRGPTIGTLLMCVASSLMGVVLFLKKRCLIGESLSHASYPGIVGGVFIFSLFFPQQSSGAFFAVLGGAFFSSLLGLKAIEWLEKKRKVRSDAAMCFVLAVFFGLGTVAASALQMQAPAWHTQVQTLLFGQAATMTDMHIYLYAALTLLVAAFVFLSFRPLQAMLFDPDFAKTASLRSKALERTLFWLLLLSLVLGIRSVGVVLMSGMAIAPAIAARQFTDRLQTMFILAALFGALSGLIGNIVSVEGTIALSTPEDKLTLPTGPAIILAGAAFALFALLFSPKRGWIFRLCRIASFRLRCLKENILKTLWKKERAQFSALLEKHRIPKWALRVVLFRLGNEGWVEKSEGVYFLSADGKRKADSIVRLHRLWELYLASELGYQGDKIHWSAEEMEHILTPDIEERLTRLLSDPKMDPHDQPIPNRLGGIL